ncbi:MAG: universal stress protein [Pseudomonadales bacterium]|nr:universal stress protein [Pseudomonadales bacterium]
MKESILAALEPTDESVNVFNVANRVAQTHEHSLDLINVVRPVVAHYPDVSFAHLADSAYAWQREVVRGNKEFFAQVPGLDTSRLNVVEGNPVHEIVQAIEKTNAAMAVMGVHNRSGLQKLLGSTTLGVLNSTDCDLLAVHPDSNANDYRRIVVAVDTSSTAGAVLSKAAKFASGAQHVEIVSVIIPLAHLYPTPYTATATAFSFTEFGDFAEKRTQEIVTEAAAKAGLPTEAVTIRTGDPRDEIVAAAKEGKADLIVIGSDSKGLISRMLLGSTARGILDRTPCDVLVCR